MSVVFLRGQFLPLEEAAVPFLDRGYLFGDGVYEVYRLYGGRPFTRDLHLDRFYASCRGIDLEVPYSRQELVAVLERIEAGAPAHCYIYFHLTRGPAPRMHAWTSAHDPGLAVMAVELGPVPEAWYRRGITLITYEDLRWARCNIKSLNLLANCMAMTEAKAKGAFEALLVTRDGLVTESAASSAFAVIDGCLRTAPLSCNILPGITRHLVLEMAREAGLPVDESAFTLEQLQRASEVFITNTPFEIMPVTLLDGREVDGPGPMTRELMRRYARRVFADTGHRAMCAVALD
ncbi:MAG: aminotransferase class IV [Bacillota bacterium]